MERHYTIYLNNVSGGSNSTLLEKKQIVDGLEVKKYYGFRSNLGMELYLKRYSKIALISMRMVTKAGGSLYTCESEGFHKIREGVLINVCTSIIDEPLPTCMSNAVLQSFVSKPKGFVDENYPYPLYHNLNISMLNTLDIYFTDINGEYVYFDKDHLIQVVLLLVM